jgi:hypothetical protein
LLTVIERIFQINTITPTASILIVIYFFNFTLFFGKRKTFRNHTLIKSLTQFFTPFFPSLNQTLIIILDTRCPAEAKNTTKSKSTSTEPDPKISTTCAGRPRTQAIANDKPTSSSYPIVHSMRKTSMEE